MALAETSTSRAIFPIPCDAIAVIVLGVVYAYVGGSSCAPAHCSSVSSCSALELLECVVTRHTGAGCLVTDCFGVNALGVSQRLSKRARAIWQEVLGPKSLKPL